MIPAWVGQYVGIPYKDRGEDLEGCDCIGLYRLVQRLQWAWEIPPLDYPSADDVDAVETLVALQKGVWSPITGGHLQEGDLMVLRLLGHPIHIGMFLPGGWMLHTLRGHASAVERIVPKWTHRIDGYWRWAKN